jgi:hypothetical protein
LEKSGQEAVDVLGAKIAETVVLEVNEENILADGFTGAIVYFVKRK